MGLFSLSACVGVCVRVVVHVGVRKSYFCVLVLTYVCVLFVCVRKKVPVCVCVCESVCLYL
jgi:hypothetical protein